MGQNHAAQTAWCLFSSVSSTADMLASGAALAYYLPLPSSPAPLINADPVWLWACGGATESAGRAKHARLELRLVVLNEIDFFKAGGLIKDNPGEKVSAKVRPRSHHATLAFQTGMTSGSTGVVKNQRIGPSSRTLIKLLAVLVLRFKRLGKANNCLFIYIAHFNKANLF